MAHVNGTLHQVIRDQGDTPSRYRPKQVDGFFEQGFLLRPVCPEACHGRDQNSPGVRVPTEL